MDEPISPILPICLVVDDSRVVRKVARRILEQNGFAVREAENGADALEVCRHGLPRCVLLDWNMPVMDGLAFLKALRTEFGPDQPPVLFCTTENERSFIAEALAQGAQARLWPSCGLAERVGDGVAQGWA